MIGWLVVCRLVGQSVCLISLNGENINLYATFGVPVL